MVHDDVGAELLGRLEAAVVEVDGDDVAGAEQPGAHDRRQTDRPGSHDGDDVAGLDRAVEDADLVAGGEDVGEHEDLLVAGAGGHRVGGVVGERHPDVLGLGAVDRVAEDPAAAAEALAVAAFAAEPAGPAGAHAGHEDPVADLHRLDPGADGVDGADGLVAEDPPVGDGGDVALEDVQIGAADRGGVDADDRRRCRRGSPASGRLPRPSGPGRGTRVLSWRPPGGRSSPPWPRRRRRR